MTKPPKKEIPNISSPPRTSEKEREQEDLQNQMAFYRHRFHQVFENVNDGIIIHDTEGHIYDVNSPMYKRLGYSKEEILAMNLKELVPPVFGKKIAENTLRIKKDGSAVFESADLRKDGRPIPVEVSARLYLEDGKPLIQSIVRDITDRKTAEELITSTLEDKQSALDDMQSCIKMITEFISVLLRPSSNLSDSTILKLARQRMNTLICIQDIILESQLPTRISSTRLIRKLLIHLSKRHWKRMSSVSIYPEVTKRHLSSCLSLVLGLLLSEIISLVLNKIPKKEPGRIQVKFSCLDRSRGQLSLTIIERHSAGHGSFLRQDDEELEMSLRLVDLLPQASLHIESTGIQIQFDL